MTTQLKKSILVNSSDDDWYADIYLYYTNQESPLLIDHTQYALIKKQTKYYKYDSLTKQLLQQIGRY